MSIASDKRKARKDKVIEMTSQGISPLFIAKELGVTEKTIRRDIKEYSDELPSLQLVTEGRLKMLIATTSDIDILLRCIALARHYICLLYTSPSPRDS